MFKDEQPLFTDDCLGIQETIAIRHHLGNHNWRVLSVFSSGAIIQELNEPGLMGFFKRLFVRTKYLLLLRSGKESEILDYYDLNSVQERVLKILKDKDCFDDADASFFQTLANPEKIAREFCEARLNSAITSEADIESKIASYIDEYNSLIAIIERNNLKIAAEPFIRRVLLDAGLLLPSTISDNSKRLLSLLKFSQKDIDLFVSRQFELRLRSKPVKGFKEAYKILSSLFEDLVVSLEQIFQREHIKLRSLSKVLEDYLIPICSPESLIELQRTLSERQGDKSPFLNLINEVFLEAYSENLINRFKVMFSGKAATIEDVLQIEEPNKNAGETYKYFVSADSKQFEFGHEKSPLLIRILEPGFELEFSTSGVSYKKQGSCRLIPYSDIRFYVKKLELTQIALDKLGSHPTGQKRWMYLKKDLTKNLRYKYNPLLDIYEYFYVLIAYEDDVLISLLFDIDYETGERKIKELVKRLRALHYFENKKDFSNYETSERDKERTPQVDRTLKPVTSEEEQESPFRPLPTCPVEADLSQEKEDKLVLREESGESHSTIVESEADPVENGTAVKHIEEEPSANLSYDEDIEIERRSKALLDHYNLISSEKLTVDDIAGLSFHAVLTLLLFELSSNGFPDEILHNVALFSKAIVDNEKDAFASLIDKVYDKALVSDSSVMLIHISKEVEELLHAFPIDNDLMSSIIKNEAMFLVLEQDIVGAETNFAEEIAVKLEKVAQQLELFFARDIQVREALMKDVLDHFRATLSGTELYLFLRNTGFYSLKGWMIEAIKQYMEGQDLQLPSDDLKNSSKGEPETKIDDTSYPAIELKRQLSCVEIGKDGKQVLIGTKDRTLEIVDLENNDKSRVLRNGLVAPISCIEAIDDIIVTGHQNGDIDFWDCKIGRLVNRIRLSRSKVIYFSYKMKEIGRAHV